MFIISILLLSIPKHAQYPWAVAITTTMIQDDDFNVNLPSNANSNLFPTNTESFYRVALPRQIHLKDEEDWEVGLHHIIYPFSWFEVPHECDHPHLLFRKFVTLKEC